MFRWLPYRDEFPWLYRTPDGFIWSARNAGVDLRSNAVVHMLSGKAIAQAIHAHFIVNAALNALLLKSVFNASLPENAASNKNEDPYLTEIAARPQDEQSTDVGKNPDLNEAFTLYKKLMAGEMFDKVFDTHSASTHNVVDAGEKALVIIYNEESTDTRDSLRYQRIREKVASKSFHVKSQISTNIRSMQQSTKVVIIEADSS